LRDEEFISLGYSGWEPFRHCSSSSEELLNSGLKLESRGTDNFTCGDSRWPAVPIYPQNGPRWCWPDSYREILMKAVIRGADPYGCSHIRWIEPVSPAIGP